MTEKCQLCQRELGTVNVDQHHLLPKTFKGKETIPLHKICHRKIHATLSERELAKYYFTIEHLLEHPDIQAFVTWVSKKAIDFYSSSNDSEHRKSKRRR